MPQLGETVAEGKITKWFKSAGDAVKPGDNLFEIETDKVSMEVPSITTGTLAEIKVQAGETALVGAVVAVIAGEGGAAASAPAAQARRRIEARAATSSVRSRASGNPGPRTGSARPRGRAARIRVSLTPISIRSSRCARRRAISARRKRRAARSSRRWRAGSPARTASISRACRAPARTAASSRADVESAIAKGGGRAAAAGDRAPARRRSRRSTRASSSRRCRSTACARPSRARLVEAKQTIPHFYLTADVTMDALLKIREEANAGAPERTACLQALGQRFRHQGAGARFAARARRQRGVGRRPHPALQAFRCRRRGRDRRRACSRR